MWQRHEDFHHQSRKRDALRKEKRDAEREKEEEGSQAAEGQGDDGMEGVEVYEGDCGGKKQRTT